MLCAFAQIYDKLLGIVVRVHQMQATETMHRSTTDELLLYYNINIDLLILCGRVYTLGGKHEHG